MPEEITLEDGSTREVPTADEMTAFQTMEDTHQTTLTDLNTKITEQEELLGDVNNLDGIKNLRTNFKTLKATLNAQGIEVDEAGNKIDKVESLSQEQVTEIAQKQAQSFAIKSVVTDKMRSLDDDQKAVVNKFFDQLTAGEEVSLDNVHGHYDAALRASGLGATEPAHPASAYASITGGGPREMKKTTPNFSETDEGKERAGQLFGDANLIGKEEKK